MHGLHKVIEFVATFDTPAGLLRSMSRARV